MLRFFLPLVQQWLRRGKGGTGSLNAREHCWEKRLSYLGELDDKHSRHYSNLLVAVPEYITSILPKVSLISFTRIGFIYNTMRAYRHVFNISLSSIDTVVDIATSKESSYSVQDLYYIQYLYLAKKDTDTSSPLCFITDCTSHSKTSILVVAY